MNEPVIPSRLLFEVDKDKRLPWVSHVATDLRAKFAAIRAEQDKQQQQPINVKTLRRSAK